ncbi:hypothetical protein QQS21_000795 [Conoideocrella luteorostrata]|uniref:Uncharacterized protein n=1 Tax=Conoideocrella luteorostrata TaxID=1105319 RepID=A0AAJ0D0P1_9HYPO|nr:hypothetical protein QQS21_000795 [Conoideocrella luteorostrata]
MHITDTAVGSVCATVGLSSNLKAHWEDEMMGLNFEASFITDNDWYNAAINLSSSAKETKWERMSNISRSPASFNAKETSRRLTSTPDPLSNPQKRFQQI